MYELAAKEGNIDALVNMALFHEYGYGVKQDYEKSIHLYNKALSINRSHMPAVYGIGWIYYKKGEYAKAKSYFKEAVGNGVAEGYNGLAYLAAKGLGEPKNIILALSLIEKALSLAPLPLGCQRIIPSILGTIYILPYFWQKVNAKP